MEFGIKIFDKNKGIGNQDFKISIHKIKQI